MEGPSKYIRVVRKETNDCPITEWYASKLMPADKNQSENR